MLREKSPGLVLECETEEGCMITAVSPEIKRALSVRQDLHRLTRMGWPEKYKEIYIKREHAPDLHIMQLSMLADEYIEEIERKKTERQNGRQKTSRT